MSYVNVNPTIQGYLSKVLIPLIVMCPVQVHMLPYNTVKFVQLIEDVPTLL
jgi:hypothetical protein